MFYYFVLNKNARRISTYDTVIQPVGRPLLIELEHFHDVLTILKCKSKFCTILKMEGYQY